MILTKEEQAYVRSKGKVTVMGTDYIIVKTLGGSSVRLSIEKIRSAAKGVKVVSSAGNGKPLAGQHPNRHVREELVKPDSTVFEDIIRKGAKQQARDVVAEQLAEQREQEALQAEVVEVEQVTEGLERLLTPVVDTLDEKDEIVTEPEPIDDCPHDVATPEPKDDGHATLAPSSMKMFKNCYASLLPLEHPLPERYSPYAAEGTACHELFATCASLLVNEGLEEALSAADNAQAKEGEYAYNDEMRLHVKALLQQCYRILNKIGRDCILSVLIENKVKFSEHIYGTIDFGILYVKDNKKKIYALDLKYGKGTPVRAEGNEQLLTYVLSIIETHSWDASEAIIAIYQPRNTDEHLDPLDLWQIDAATIKKARRELRRFETIALKVMAGSRKAKEVVGDWCQFCKRKNAMECKTYAKAARLPGLIELDKAKPLIKTPEAASITDEQLDLICRNAERVRTFLKEVETFVATRCLSANPLAGWKLVAGKQTRKWLENEVAVAEALKEAGVVNPWKQVLKGIGEVERALGKAKAKDALAPLTRKSTPKPKLVTEDDPRPAITNDSASLLTCLDDVDTETNEE